MHFLGAVIAEKQDDIYGILAEWSEYVKETRSEIIANSRADDQAYLEDHGNDTDPMHEKFKKAAAGRLALDDEAARRAGVLPSEDAGQEPTSPHTPCAGWKSTASSSHRRTSPERPSPPASRSSDWAASTSC